MSSLSVLLLIDFQQLILDESQSATSLTAARLSLLGFPILREMSRSDSPNCREQMRGIVSH